jgi:hypothetical protein
MCGDGGGGGDGGGQGPGGAAGPGTGGSGLGGGTSGGGNSGPSGGNVGPGLGPGGSAPTGHLDPTPATGMGAPPGDTGGVGFDPLDFGFEPMSLDLQAAQQALNNPMLDLNDTQGINPMGINSITQEEFVSIVDEANQEPTQPSKVATFLKGLARTGVGMFTGKLGVMAFDFLDSLDIDQQSIDSIFSGFNSGIDPNDIAGALGPGDLGGPSDPTGTPTGGTGGIGGTGDSGGTGG